MPGRSLFFGLIVPLALLAGQLSTLAHSMAVAHERCPEHGELVHRASGSTTFLGAADTRGGAATVALRALTSMADHGHDHCISMWGRREIIGAPPQPSAALVPPPETAAPSIGAPVHAARRVLLSFAPKTSPPLPA